MDDPVSTHPSLRAAKGSALRRWGPGESPDPRARVRSLLVKWGWNAAGFQVLERGFSYHFDGDDACVAFMEVDGGWVAAGEPIAPPQRIAEVARGFVECAREAGRRASFFGVEAPFLERTGYAAVHIGEQAAWDPREWGASLAARRSLREQLRRARAKGVRIRAVSASELSEPNAVPRRHVENMVTRWLATRGMAPMRFLVDVQLFEFLEDHRYFSAEQSGNMVAFLSAVPVFGRSGWLLEDWIRDPSAPNGTTELLIDGAMKALALEGSEFVTMGLAPLSGAVPPWLARVADALSAFYDFRGIYAFKSKLGPRRWDSIHLAYPSDGSPLAALYDTLQAFSGGGFISFGARTLLRGPTLLNRALAILLVPWTIVLATANRDWFPSPVIQFGWVVFDVGLAVALLALSLRWRHWLAIVLATAVTCDAVLTTIEAVVYNLPRAAVHEWLSGLVIAVACGGPALSAICLWGAVRRRWTIAARR